MLILIKVRESHDHNATCMHSMSMHDDVEQVPNRRGVLNPHAHGRRTFQGDDRRTPEMGYAGVVVLVVGSGNQLNSCAQQCTFRFRRSVVDILARASAPGSELHLHLIGFFEGLLSTIGNTCDFPADALAANMRYRIIGELSFSRRVFQHLTKTSCVRMQVSKDEPCLCWKSSR